VLAAAGEYQEIGELLVHHATLQATNKELREHMEECDESAEVERSELAAFIKRRTDELLLLNNRLAQLKYQREAFEHEARLQEAAKDGFLEVASQQTLAYGQIVMVADNLFSQCKLRSHIAHATMAGTMQQLEVIGNFVSDLAAVCQQQSATESAVGAAVAQGGFVGNNDNGGGGT
jgi:predicted nuclease with TOPRIM domain